MFAAAALVGLREGLEMSLILGIIFSYLRKLNRKDGFKHVWLGSSIAFVLCLVVGGLLYHFTSEEEWSGQAYLELFIFLIAVGVLSYMTFWMKKNSRSMSGQLQGQIDKALDGGSIFQLTFLAFITVVRESLELVMFLLALATQNHNAATVSAGGLSGLLIAAIIGWGIYRGTSHINLKLFFKVMGNILIVVAAGLLGNAVSSAIEVGWLHPVTYVYNLQDSLNHHGLVGSILHALIGYSDHPSIIQAAIWILFLVIALTLFNRNRQSPAVKSVA
jgi:high-affinity iron transporter